MILDSIVINTKSSCANSFLFFYIQHTSNCMISTHVTVCFYRYSILVLDFTVFIV